MSDTTGSGSSQGPDREPTDHPYGQPPAYPPPPPQHNPYGASEREQPPGAGQQPPPPAPYGQQAGQQYGQPYAPPPGQQQGAEYGAQYGQAYGAPHGQPVPDRRPGTVTAAGVITLIFSGITGALFVLGLVALGVAREELVRQLRDESGLANIDPNDIVSVMLVLFLVLVVWCVAAMVLAVFAMRRSNGARIGLVVSSAAAALLALLGIGSGVSAITLVAAVAVIICLFAGGAGQWYAGGSGPRAPRASGPVA